MLGPKRDKNGRNLIVEIEEKKKWLNRGERSDANKQ